MLTAERVRELLDYDPDTGELRWRVSRGSAPAGAVAGSLALHGYIKVHVDGRHYYAHRIIWLHVYGRWPREQVDHVDLDGMNNRLSNLREATGSQNGAKRKVRKDNRIGYKGVRRHRNTYQALIRKQGVRLYLGCFPTAEEAHAAYARAAADAHGEYARVK